MSGDRVIGASPAQQEEEEVRWIVIAVPLVVSVILFVSVIAYRCRAHRLRRDRIAQEREQEVREMKGAPLRIATELTGDLCTAVVWPFGLACSRCGTHTGH